MSAVNPPDSPPVGPVIPEGLATKLGKIVTALLALNAVLIEAGVYDLSSDTSAMLDKMLVVLGLLMGGRYLQGAAAEYGKAKVPPLRTFTPLSERTQPVASGTAGAVTFGTGSSPEQEKTDDEHIAATEGAADLSTDHDPAPDEGDGPAATRDRPVD